MDYRYLIIPAVIVLLIIIFGIFFHFKKKAVIKKVNALSPREKETLLDALAKPVGYMYDPHQDIFTAGLDAPQKIFGYTTFYDLSTPYFNMIFDYETIYFNYDARTWLIELWKGQWVFLQNHKISALIPLFDSKIIPCCISSLTVSQKHCLMSHTAQTVLPYFSPFITATANILSLKEPYAVWLLRPAGCTANCLTM